MIVCKDPEGVKLALDLGLPDGGSAGSSASGKYVICAGSCGPIAQKWV